MFLSKGVGAGPIVTQLGPVCAQIYALSARSKLTASRTVSDELRQADIIIITKTEYSDYLSKWLYNPYLQSMTTVIIMSITEEVKRIIRTNQMGINQVLNLVCRSKAKEGRTPLFNANNLPGKDPAVGINGFEGVGPKWLLPRKEVLVYVLEESKI